MRKFIFLITIFSVFLLKESYSQNIALRFNPPLGTEYSTEFDIYSTVRQIAMGIEQNVEVNMHMEMYAVVTENTADFCLVIYKYKKLTIQSSDGITSYFIDSDSKSPDKLNGLFQSMIDKNFKVKFNKKGEVMEVTGLNLIISKIIENIDQSDPMYESYKKTLTESFGVNTLRQNFQQLSVSFPEKELKKGDFWEFNMNTKANQFNVIINNLAELKSVDDNRIIIGVNSTITSSANKNVDMEGMTGQINMKGNQISEMQIDPGTGLTKSGIVNQNIEGILKLTTGESDENVLEIPMKISSKIIVFSHILE